MSQPQQYQEVIVIIFIIPTFAEEETDTERIMNLL